MNSLIYKRKLFFYNIPVTLFTLIPIFLISGPFLSDLSVSLISLIFLIYCIKEKNYSPFKNKYFYFFFIFWCYLLLNSYLNFYNYENFLKVFFLIRFGVFVIAIVFLLNTDSKFLKYFFYCIFFAFLILILDGFLQYFSSKNILGWSNGSRTSSLFGEERVLGSYLSRLWPIFFGMSIFIYEKKNKLFFLFLLIFILSEVLIFLSGDRTAFFYINLSAIFIIIFSKKLFKLRFFTLLSSVFIILIINQINPTAKERFIDQTLKQMNFDLNNVDKIYLFSEEHTHQYITAYKMFLDNKIFGVGPKNFRYLCNNEIYTKSELSCSTHPHNAYIEILAETGIVGFSFLLFVLFIFLWHTLKHLYLKFKGKIYFSDFEICILSGVAIYLWPFIPTGSIYTNWLTILMILNIPLFIWSRGLKKS